MNQFEHLKDDDPEDQDETVCNREEDCSINNNRRKTVSPAVGEHPLQYNYTLWYSRRTPSRPANTQSYEQNIRQIGTVASVEQFWKFYSHLVRPGDLTGHSDFHLFKEGIKPMWEDEANKNGGKWIIRLRKGLASRFWENIILAMLLILLLTGLASRFWENIILTMLLILLLTGLASRFWENIILTMLLILLLTGLASRFWENIILAMLGEQFMVGEEICGVVVSIRFQEDILSIWNKTASDQVTTSRIRDTLRRVLNLPPNTIMEYKTHNDSLKDNSSFRNTKITL
uniref:Eukaryotic translation initiation factor 4E type 2 n=1 Tax=Oncorhynchus tshawytscha TaxID=74940 RepID=A0AAZ3NUV3_ONCTS